MSDTKTVIFYHGNCSDGFGGAYAAWKKFGDAAEYIPLSRGKEPPYEKAEGAEIYFIDFVYVKEDMDRFAKIAKRMVLLDHHEGVEEVTKSFPEHTYDSNHSGAMIAWNYFHPDTKAPELLQYVEEGDLYRFTLPNVREILTYIYTKPREFEAWDELQKELTENLARVIERGTSYSEYGRIIVGQMQDHAKLIDFEGYRCYLALSTSFFHSEVGNGLANKLPPIAVIANASTDGLRVSLRRAKDSNVDLAKIAQKYGGNGHPYAAAFSISWGAPIPWTLVEDENPRD
jgi:uncharacterized protein